MIFGDEIAERRVSTALFIMSLNCSRIAYMSIGKVLYGKIEKVLYRLLTNLNRLVLVFPRETTRKLSSMAEASTISCTVISTKFKFVWVF